MNVGDVAAGETVQVVFEIGLNVRAPFKFFVDAFGIPQQRQAATIDKSQVTGALLLSTDLDGRALFPDSVVTILVVAPNPKSLTPTSPVATLGT